MTDSPTRKTKSIIMVRVSPEFKTRFDAACEHRGWKLQKALEKITQQFVETVEAEQRPAGGSVPPRGNLPGHGPSKLRR